MPPFVFVKFFCGGKSAKNAVLALAAVAMPNNANFLLDFRSHSVKNCAEK